MQSQMSEEFVQGNVNYNGMEDKVKLCKLPVPDDEGCPNYLMLDHIPDKSHDFVQISFTLASTLNVLFSAPQSFLRSSRYTKVYSHSYRILKDDGYIFTPCSSAVGVEEQRTYMENAGFLTVGYINRGKPTIIEIFGYKLPISEGKEDFIVLGLSLIHI